MATVSTVATKLPAHKLTPEDTLRSLQRVMQLPHDRELAFRSIFEHAGVAARYSPYPIEYLAEPRSLTQSSAEYRQNAISLGCAVSTQCLRKAGVAAQAVDFLIAVSCTGLMMPSLDAYIVNEIGLRRDVKRLPITELGCAGGAAALSRARDFTNAYPGSTVLVVAVEFPTLTYQPGDTSMANLVSCALFGDGAAAALVSSDPNESGARIIDCESHLFPESYDALGFELLDGGLHIVLGSALPSLIRAGIGDLVDRFLCRHGLKAGDVGFWAIHPGGKKLVVQIEEEFNLSPAKTQPTWDILRDHGNMSSASILFVLERWLESRALQQGDFGIMMAFGPGFSVELLLLQWA